MKNATSQQQRIRAKNLILLLVLFSFVHGLILLGHQRFWEGGTSVFVALALLAVRRIGFLFQRTIGIAKIVLFLQLISLGFLARYANWAWSEIFIVIDLVLIAFLQEYIQTPEESPIDLWKSVKNALLLAVPITATILLIFKFYPDIKPTDTSVPFATTGFGLNGELNPGSIEALNESNKKAFVVSFPQGGKLPRAENIYWRGQVLTKNDGFRWRQENLAFAPMKSHLSNESFTEQNHTTPIEHFIRLPGRFSGFTFALDAPISVAEETDTVTTLPPLWGNTYWKPSSAWKSRTIIANSLENGVEEPPPTEAERQVLLAFNDTRLESILPVPLVESNAEQTLDGYFGSGKFEYSLSPGTMKSDAVWEFLQVYRRGFCEHFAASAANLLRANKIPSRIVTGYFGGEWSSWDNTLVVREKHAHAWVEFWSKSRSRWIRYDAVRMVSPERLREVRQTFSREGPGMWFGAAFQTISNIIESSFEIVDASTSSFQDLIPDIDVDILLISILAFSALIIIFFLLRNFIHENSHPMQQQERLAKEFRKRIQFLGIDTDSSLTFRQMAKIAKKRSRWSGKWAQDFVDSFELVHYANEPLTRPLKKHLRICLKQMSRGEKHEYE